MYELRAPSPAPVRVSAEPAPGSSPRLLPWLAAIAVVCVAVQLAFVVPGSGLGWDETVYVSQAGGDIPAAFFSAPRARGISYLVAPVTALTASTTVLRIYLAVLSAGALVGAFQVWRTLVPGRVLVCAGALFATLWPTLFYGSMAMPNLWCALGTLAATGWVARALLRGAGRAELLGAGAAVAVVVLMRPADGAWLALPLVLVTVVRPRMAAALAVGLLAGAAPWVVEAFAHYGGPLTRLHRASEIQGGLGWNLAVDDQAKALEGRTLCRPCTIPWKRPGTTVWWALLPFLAAGGVVVARRPGRSAVILLATGTAVSLAVPYLFLIEYAAPRFLLPAYALLSLPVAECLVRLYDRARRPAGRLTGQWRVVALAAVLAAHLAVQLQVTSRVSASSHSTSADFTAVAAALHRNGIRPPCVISGAQAVPIAYYAGCASRQTGGHDASVTPAGLRDAARRVQAAVLVAGGGPRPGYAPSGPPVFLAETRDAGPYSAYLFPPPDSTPAGAPPGS
ncbi:hypothetical protein OG345_31815 [Streptomyces sp. NBC_01220]|uniref:hypothetical protein n=1 Tax=unclassified Streptomyces TaxID=2593676 RepID=UPI002E2C991E|nr:hypothetical protein [Streptomyces sp. NBC_00184]WSQ47256.1 hypothetical protein OG345_31815 [Streptomyces sp. NBC_01220]